MARTDLAYYSGDDVLTLPLLSVGAAGVVGVADARRDAADRRDGARLPRGDVAARATCTTSCCRCSSGCSGPRASS